MITIAIENFRGCAEARIECAPIALLAGLNGAGKSSIAQAVGCALTGEPYPAKGFPRAFVGAIVRMGADRAEVEVSHTDGSVRTTWPEARSTTAGTAPTAGENAVGLDSIVALAPRERLRILAQCLHAQPSRDELMAALTERGLGFPHVIDSLWSAIETSGWDGAERHRRERGAEMKGQWRGVTGANYGSKIGASWRNDLADERESDLLAAVNRATQARDNAISAEAVSESERLRYLDEASDLDGKSANVIRFEGDVKEAEQAFARTRAHRQNLPAAERRKSIPCPYCDGPIFVHQDLGGTSLEKAGFDDLDDAELKRRRLAIAEADGALAKANDDLAAARRKLGVATAIVERARKAKERLANWPRAVESGTDLDTASAALARAEKRLGEFRVKIEADKIHEMIENNEVAIDLLGADGLRAQKLEQVLDVFVQATLRPLSVAARWGEVSIDEAGNIAYSGRPYALLSTSEQYRVRAIVAAGMAQLDGSALLVFDGADVLDAPSRSGLFGLIRAAGIPALVCMTAPRREQVPDLEQLRLGRSYWIERGTIEAIEGPSKAAA
jgi:hypothetical protein